MGWLSKPVPSNVAEQTRRDETQQLPTPPAPHEMRNGTSGPKKSDFNATISPKAQGLPPNVELRECRKEDIKSFKRLNSLLLPIPYADSFYREIMEDEITSKITLMALWHDDSKKDESDKGILVGAIRCRLLSQLPGVTPSSQRKDGPMLYLSTLVLLSPYRGHGIAAKMLEVLIKRAVNDYGIASVGAHVWEANEEGLAWYRKRGFKEVGRELDYYRKLDPTSAVVMMKEIGVMDMVGD